MPDVTFSVTLKAAGAVDFLEEFPRQDDGITDVAWIELEVKNWIRSRSHKGKLKKHDKDNPKPAKDDTLVV